ncbi:MAG: rRNA maturation RNase YbeY, partial [Pseudomonadota bacterium]
MARVDVVFEDERWETLELGKLAGEVADATLACLGFDPNAFEISILACDDARIAALNADFRDKPQPTNVLSWPSSERVAKTDGATPNAPDPMQDQELGDIAISYDTCMREAAEAGKPMRDHVT